MDCSSHSWLSIGAFPAPYFTWILASSRYSLSESPSRLSLSNSCSSFFSSFFFFPPNQSSYSFWMLSNPMLRSRLSMKSFLSNSPFLTGEPTYCYCLFFQSAWDWDMSKSRPFILSRYFLSYSLVYGRVYYCEECHWGCLSLLSNFAAAPVSGSCCAYYTGRFADCSYNFWGCYYGLYSGT
jgi:hypothetical protein